MTVSCVNVKKSDTPVLGMPGLEVEEISYVQILGKGLYALQPSLRNGVWLRADPGCAGRDGHLYTPLLPRKRLDPGSKGSWKSPSLC